MRATVVAGNGRKSLNGETNEPGPWTDKGMNRGIDFEAAIEACRDGDKKALKQIYDQESPRLLAMAYRLLKDRQAAEDVLQDAFVQVWTKAETFDRRRGSGRGWLYTIVRHRALATIRSAHSTRTVSLDKSSHTGDGDASLADKIVADPEFAGTPEELALRRCLSELSDDRARYIKAAYLDGYSHSEMAEHFSVPLGTLKSAIRRGLLSLRECLGWN